MKQKTVLLVDDDIDICNVLSLALEREYNVIKTNSGQDAIILLNEHYKDINILIADIRLKDYSGVDLYLLARNKCGPELRTIFVTGNDDFENVELLRNEPNVKIKMKPFSPSGLCADIKEMFS